MARYYVETRDPPPNTDLLHVSEHRVRADAVMCARGLGRGAKVWVETEDDEYGTPVRRLIDLDAEPPHPNR